MSNLEQLLKEKYPESEISHIERKAFQEGVEHAHNPSILTFPVGFVLGWVSAIMGYVIHHLNH